MTYVAGGLIQAADFDGFAGPLPPSQAYSNPSAAADHMAALIGVGYGDRGYGQTSTTLPAVTAGQIITAATWNNLLNSMGTSNTHQGSGLTLQPTVAPGGRIIAQDGNNGTVSISTLINTLDSNRLSANVTEMTVSSVLTSSTSTPWGGIIEHVFTVNFGTEDAARYFFNSGGQIRLSGSNVGGSTPDAASWAALLSQMGTIKFGATTTTYTGSGGTVASIGYYGMTGSNQQLFIHYGSGTHYAGNYYAIQAYRGNYSGANGGNGSLLTFTATFNNTSGYYYHGSTVNGTTTSYVDQYKVTGVLSIQNPSFATTTSL